MSIITNKLTASQVTTAARNIAGNPTLASYYLDMKAAIVAHDPSLERFFPKTTVVTNLQAQPPAEETRDSTSSAGSSSEGDSTGSAEEKPLTTFEGIRQAALGFFSSKGERMEHTTTD
ncbi:MAG: hypothetical protein WCG14_04295 [Chlamydiia bacterium]